MASRTGPRSATDATRFTSTTPQPKSKASTAKPGPLGETVEQRVARLRAAHLAARNAPLSRTDRMINAGRRFFDIAHTVTVTGLIGLTVITGVFTAYAVIDMVQHNKKRRADFIEAQKVIENDNLAAARLAFINGTATEEQTLLVEEVMKISEMTGERLPPLLSSPNKATPKKASLFEQVDAKVQAEKGDTTAAHIAQQKTEEMRQKVREAFEKEKGNQRKGGALDQLDLDSAKKMDAPAPEPAPTKKLGWGWW